MVSATLLLNALQCRFTHTKTEKKSFGLWYDEGSFRGPTGDSLTLINFCSWLIQICDLKFKPTVENSWRGQRGSLPSASLTAPLCPGGDHWWRVLRSRRLTQGEPDSRRPSSTHGLKDDGAFQRCYDSSWRSNTGEGQVLLSLTRHSTWWCITCRLPNDSLQVAIQREKVQLKNKALLFQPVCSVVLFRRFFRHV